MNEWWTHFFAWLPDWVLAIFLVIAAVVVIRLVFGTHGVRSKLDDINEVFNEILAIHDVTLLTEPSYFRWFSISFPENHTGSPRIS